VGPLVFYAIELSVLLAALAAVAGVRLKPALAWALTAAGLMAFIAEVRHSSGYDLRAFWLGGQNVWVGRSPYEPRPGVPVPLNPPTAFPLFAAFALLPFGTCVAVWTALNSVACLALVGLSARALRAEAEPGDPRRVLNPSSIGVLSSAVALSFAARYGIDLGQLAVLTAIALIGAVLARVKGRWFTSAVCLAVATVKVGTMLPFLLLFCGRGDRKTLIALAAVGLALVLAATPATAVPGRFREMVGNIARLDKTVNSYEYANVSSAESFGIDHALYRLGLRNRSLIWLGQALILVVLGTIVAFEASPRGRLPRGAVVSLVALYAELFLYHRVYDTVLLALPLVYTAGRANLERGLERILPAVAGVAVLAVMYLRVGLLRTLTSFALGAGAGGQAIQALVLPYATWSILLAMACLLLANRRPPVAKADSVGRLPE
jgi:hypothetical protein